MSQPENIGVIWESVSKDLKSFIISRIKSEVEADDILQELYIKMHENINSLKSREKIRPWIYQITRNLIADHFRETTRVLNNDEIRSSVMPVSSPQKFMTQAISDMVTMMDSLPPEYCEALCLTELEGMSQKDYALKLGISYSGAKSRVQRARFMLRDMLMKCCHYQFDKYGTVISIHPACCCCCEAEK
jgi:RNA polymerase sigma-70 factor (ECF subfamily)